MSSTEAAPSPMAGVLSQMKSQQKKKNGAPAGHPGEEAEGNDECQAMNQPAAVTIDGPSKKEATTATVATVVAPTTTSSSVDRVGVVVNGTPIYGDDVDCAPILKEKFVTQGYKDIWFAIIFLVQLLATFSIAVYNVQHHDVSALDFGFSTNHDGAPATTAPTRTSGRQADWGGFPQPTAQQPASTIAATASPSSGNDSSNQRKSIHYLGAAFFISLIVCLMMMTVMRLHAKAYIWGANILSILLWIVCGFYILSVKTDEDSDAGKYISAIVCFFFAAIHAWWLCYARNRVPFAAVLLKNAVKTTMDNYGTYFMSFLQLVGLILYMVVYSLMVIPTLQSLFATTTTTSSSSTTKTSYSSTGTGGTTHRSSTSSSSSSTATGGGDSAGQWAACLLLLLCWFWTIQVMVNVVHVTASGAVATWYFAGDNAMPPAPSLAAAKRAVTTSFGSICFGSLLVAILKVIEAVLRGAARRNGLAAAVAYCLIGCIQRLLEYFNAYAFSHVAIYGMSYIESGKATWAMVKECGWSALFNDNLVYPVLNMTCFLDSLVIGVIMGLASSSVILGIACFFVSYVVHIIMFRVVYSGIVTMFVCTAECEDACMESNPEFHAEVQAAKQQFLGGQANQQDQNRSVWV